MKDYIKAMNGELHSTLTELENNSPNQCWEAHFQRAAYSMIDKHRAKLADYFMHTPGFDEFTDGLAICNENEVSGFLRRFDLNQYVKLADKKRNYERYRLSNALNAVNASINTVLSKTVKDPVLRKSISNPLEVMIASFWDTSNEIESGIASNINVLEDSFISVFTALDQYYRTFYSHFGDGFLADCSTLHNQFRLYVSEIKAMLDDKNADLKLLIDGLKAIVEKNGPTQTNQPLLFAAKTRVAESASPVLLENENDPEETLFDFDI